ncbi:MAG: hypothetical protein J6T10_01595 [Methanobrevibacter sp.]|nr:hypothetical protein [Methanobrevibacter sp.]
MNIIYKCKLCPYQTKKVREFGYHIRKEHNYTNEVYFNKYMKEIGEGYCYYCGKPTGFLSLQKRYKTHCNMSCSIKDPIIQNKMKQNCLEKTGYENKMQDPEYRKQWEKNFEEKYGVKNPGQKFRNEDKFKKTCKDLYGGCGKASEIINKKCEQTNLKNTGHVWANNTEKLKETNLKKRGVEYTIGPEYTKKMFNVNNVSQLDSIKEKKIETCRLHYGCDNPSQSEEINKNKKKKYTYNNINFDSSWEIAYYIWLTDNKIPFEYHPKDKFVYVVNNSIKFYFPDFKVNNEFIEIKSLHFFVNKNPNGNMINPYKRNKYTPEELKIRDDIMEAKHQCMIENNIKILTDCSIYIRYVNQKYGKNFLKTLKIKVKNNE